MRIVILYRYFWPDAPPYATMLKTIAEGLTKDGHEIVVLCGQPSYGAARDLPRQPSPENLCAGLDVRRCSFPFDERSSNKAFKILNWAWYYLWCAWYLIGAQLSAKTRPDLYWTASIPPVAQGLFAGIFARLFSAKLLYHVQDVYPEALGNGKADYTPPALLRWLDNSTINRANALVTLSDDMMKTIRTRAPKARFKKINNFSITPNMSTTAANSNNRTSAAFRYVFAGNLGRFQQLGQLIEAAGNCHEDTNPPIELHLVGTGALEKELRNCVDQNGYSNIFFHSYRAPEEIGSFLQTFDAGVVSLRAGLLDVAFPSKTLTYWANDLPVLAIVDADRELGRLINETASGLVCADNDVEGIAVHLRSMAQSKTPWTGVEERTRHLWSAEDAVMQWRNLIAGLANDEIPPKRQVS